MKKKIKEPVHVVYGAEQYLVEETIRQIKQSRLGKSAEEHQVYTFDCSETDITEVLFELETASFFGGDKLAVAKNCNWLSTTGKLPSEASVEALVNYVRMPVLENTLIIHVHSEKLDARKSVVKTLSNNDYVALHACNELKEHELPDWLNNRVKSYGKTLDAGAVQVLVSLVGSHLQILDQELQKLALYSESDVITEHDARLLVAPATDLVVFPLFNELIAGNGEGMMRMYRQLIRNGENPLQLLAFLTTQTRTYYEIAMLSKMGVPQQDIAKQAGRHPFVVKKALGEIRRCPQEQLSFYMDQLAQVEIDVKQHFVPPMERLERFFLEVMHYLRTKRRR
ncbi:MAG: DNA polymerase III subunit delta [Bacilli bacterium]